jgi:broad-specificity NMP kinase
MTTVAVELVGPPGSGKSTLLAALAAHDPRVAYVHRARTARVAPYLFCGAAAAAPLLVADRLTWQQTRWIARVEAAALLVRCMPPSRMPAVVFAQGPVYSLVRLSGSHPVTPKLCRWRAVKTRQLADLLDVVVVLDAPDEVLLHRIRTRAKAPPRRTGSDLAGTVVAPFRSALRSTLEELMIDGGPRVLRFDTGQESPQEMAGSLLDLLYTREHS